MSQIDPIQQFKQEVRDNVKKLGENEEIKKTGIDFCTSAWKGKYPYNFAWMGRPIIQIPQDIVAMQEIIWEVQPDLVIETGVAHGGGLIFYASILEMIGKGEVLGIDVDIRDHNRKEIESHPMSKRITMIEGSSTDREVVKKAASIANGRRAMVILDSLHTHDHVLEELKLYSPLVSKGSYLVVFDTIIEYLPKGFFSDRPWDKGNNPATAIKEFLKDNDEFVIDGEMDNKLIISAALGGYLKKVK